MKPLRFSACLGALALTVSLPGQGVAVAQTPAAVCTAPQPPTPLSLTPLKKPKMPDKPACASNNRCRQGDVNTYNVAIDRYNSALFEYNDQYNKHTASFNLYVSELNVYAANIQAYLNCERQRLIEAVDG